MKGHQRSTKVTKGHKTWSKLPKVNFVGGTYSKYKCDQMPKLPPKVTNGQQRLQKVSKGHQGQ